MPHKVLPVLEMNVRLQTLCEGQKLLSIGHNYHCSFIIFWR